MRHPATLRRALLAASCLALAAPRAALADAVNWTIDASGQWTAATNWSSNPALPGPTSDVTIDRPAGDFLITLSSGNHSVNSLLSTERLALTGGTLAVASTLQMQNTLTLAGTTLLNAALSTSGGGVLAFSSGTINNVSLSGTANWVASSNFSLVNNLTLSNAILQSSAFNGYAVLNVSAPSSILGTGTLTLNSSGGYYSQIMGTGTLTLGSGISLLSGTGNSSAIASLITSGLINQGLVSGRTSGAEVAIGGSFLANSGTLEAINGGRLTITSNLTNTGTIVLNNGILNLGGSLTQATLGTLTRTGGTLNLTGTLTGGLALNAATGSWNLSGTLVGGTLTTSGGASLNIPSTATFDNLSLGSNFTFTSNSSITVRNNLNFGGNTVTLSATSTYPGLNTSGIVTFNGPGVIVFDSNSGYYGQIGGNTITLGPAMTVRTGSGTSSILGILSGASLLNQGLILSSTPGRALQISAALFDNAGTIDVSNGGILSIISTDWINHNLINASSSTLTLTNNWINSGTINASNSVTNLAGTITAGAPDAWTGKIDLKDNGIIIDVNTANKAAVIATLQNLLLSGRNGGTFDGPGITSSTVSGVPNTRLILADNSDMHITVFRGLSVSPAALVITSAHDGDASLDGNVDAFDLNILAAHWQLPANATWSSGDFTLDGKVDAFDLNVLAANWQYHAALLPAEAFPGPTFLDALHSVNLVPVPEPASLTLLALAPLLFQNRRRRRA